MYSHCNFWAYTSSQISEHPDRSTVVPLILARYAVKIVVEEQLSNRRQLLVGSSLFDSEESQDAFDKKWLAEFE